MAIGELVSKDIRRKAGTKPDSPELPTAIVDCNQLQPENSDIITKRQPHTTRCVFSKEDKIIKIATGEIGRKENKGAKQVLNNIEENTDAFAMPKEVSKDNNILIQEKVEDNTEKIIDKDKPSYKRTNPVKKLENKLEQVQQEEIVCKDIRPNNIGIKNNKPVLLDLGKCKMVNQDE